MFARRASTRGQGKVPCACVCIRRCIIGLLCANRASPLNLLQQNFWAAAIIKEVLADPQKRAAAYAEMEVGAGMPPGSRLVWRRHVDGIARTWSDACDVALRTPRFPAVPGAGVGSREGGSHSRRPYPGVAP